MVGHFFTSGVLLFGHQGRPWLPIGGFPQYISFNYFGSDFHSWGGRGTKLLLAVTGLFICRTEFKRIGGGCGGGGGNDNVVGGGGGGSRSGGGNNDADGRDGGSGACVDDGHVDGDGDGGGSGVLYTTFVVTNDAGLRWLGIGSAKHPYTPLKQKFKNHADKNVKKTENNRVVVVRHRYLVCNSFLFSFLLVPLTPSSGTLCYLKT